MRGTLIGVDPGDTTGLLHHASVHIGARISHALDRRRRYQIADPLKALSDQVQKRLLDTGVQARLDTVTALDTVAQDYDIGNIDRLLEPVTDFGRRLAPNQKSVHLTREQGLQKVKVADLTLTTHRQHALITRPFQLSSTQGDETCKKRVFQFADKETDNLTAARPELLGGTVRAVSQTLRDLGDSLTRLLGHTRTAPSAVQHMRSGTLMNPCLAGYLSQRCLHVFLD